MKVSIWKGAYEFLELGAVAVFAAEDDAVRRKPVIEQAVEQQSRSVTRPVCGFFVGVTNALPHGELQDGAVFRRVMRFGAVAEHVDQIPADDQQSLALLRVELGCAGSVGKRVFGDRDDGFVFAEYQPGPDSLAFWQVAFHRVVITLRIGVGGRGKSGVRDWIQGVVPQAYDWKKHQHKG